MLVQTAIFMFQTNIHSDPMRITKKFAGSNGIGKQIFSPTIETEKTLEVRKTLEREIEELEKRFFKRIDYALAQPAVLAARRGSASETVPHGYRIAFPADNEDAEPLDYSSLLNLYTGRKATPASPAATTATSPSTNISIVNELSTAVPRLPPQVDGIASKPSSGIFKPLVKPEPAYIDESYRVHGFEALKKESVKRVLSPAKEIVVAPPPVYQREKDKDKVHINKKYHVAKTEVPPAPSNTKSTSATLTVDPSIDLHASALLLDFFRAARDKEYSDSESNGKRGGVYIDNNYRVSEASSQAPKRFKSM